MNINWDSSTSHVFINPSYCSYDQTKFNSILLYEQLWPGHLWVSTSGSTEAKWVGLSKQAILTSAQAVNKHLQVNISDCWIHALPHFHVGGIGIWARSFLSETCVHDFRLDNENRWNPHAFQAYVEDKRGTLTALVPTQLHDLVSKNIRSPASLRTVIIGGGALSEELYFAAVKLGWNVLPSYGMTECASQVATAELESWNSDAYPQLKLLEHVQAVIQEDERIKLKSQSLLSTYAIFSEKDMTFTDPKQEGWFVSEDRGSLHFPFLQVHGRMDQMIKIGGESVDIVKLESILQKIRFQHNPSIDMTLIPYPDERLGYVIHLAITASSVISPTIMDIFNQQVLPFERIRHVHHLTSIPRSSLSKVLKKELLKIIS